MYVPFRLKMSKDIFQIYIWHDSGEMSWNIDNVAVYGKNEEDYDVYLLNIMAMANKNCLNK